jgi:serine/threonine protein kinase/Tfp pilus assembly protein PilF
MPTTIGPYELLERLGSGGMGVVYRARDTRLHRDVAIKQLQPSYFGSGPPGQATHERFLREARASSSLNHPNICTIHDVGEQDGKPYLVMELLQGQTLREALQKGPLPIGELLEFALQLARGLEEAHEFGIIHRDIKPANIFIVRRQQDSPQIKILDFGLAKQTRDFSLDETSDATGESSGSDHSLTVPGSTVGTVAYMSPEQARGQVLDARSDLFSLGTVLYEMATGKRPFPGNVSADILASLLTREPDPPRKINPAIPKELERIILKLLARERNDRFQSAGILRAELERVMGRSTVSRAAVPVHTGSIGRRLPLIAGSLLILAAIAAGLYLWKRAPHAKPAEPVSAAIENPTTADATTAAKDRIVLSDFANKTGDAAFDATLNQPLAIQLEQSPLLTVVSQEHLRQSMQYLGKSSSDKITPQAAREIAIREGIKAFINGSIARFGDKYLIILEAQATSSGDTIAREQAEAADKDHVLDALDQAAATLRDQLGKSLAAIPNIETPFGQATTPSLEAFRAFALGDIEHQKGNDVPEAERHYRHAIELDPNFAMAWSRLGVVLGNADDPDRANECFKKAYELSAHVSESERLYIASHYYQFVLGNIPKVIETLELATKTYPDNPHDWINLGWAYASLGEIEKYLDATKKAMALHPNDGNAQGNYINGLLNLDRFDEAKQTAENANALGVANFTEFHRNLLELAFLRGDQAGMQEQIDWAIGKPDEYDMVRSLALIREFEGKYREAQQLYAKAESQATQQKIPATAAQDLLSQATGLAIADRCQQVPDLVKQALATDHTKFTLRHAGLASALCGDGKKALTLLEAEVKKYPEDTMLLTRYLPMTRAADDLVHQHPDQALRDMDIMGDYNLICPQEYIRGLAYLQLRDGADAAAAFRRATKYRGAALDAPNQDYGQAQLGLARAEAMLGDKTAAKQAYHDFFNTWKEADQDLPQQAQAKAEFAGLN